MILGDHRARGGIFPTASHLGVARLATAWASRARAISTAVIVLPAGAPARGVQLAPSEARTAARPTTGSRRPRADLGGAVRGERGRLHQVGGTGDADSRTAVDAGEAPSRSTTQRGTGIDNEGRV